MAEVYRYEIVPEVPLDGVEECVVLALLAVQSLHGESQTRLDARHLIDACKRSLVVDASTAVGRDLSRLVAGFLTSQFGPDGFTVERVDSPRPQNTARAAKGAK